MPSVRFQPSGKTIHVSEGVSIRDAAHAAGVDLDSPCGGRARCGKCRVRVLNGSAPVYEEERRHLLPGELSSGVRLACVQKVYGDLTVEVASLASWDVKASLASLGAHGTTSPHVRKVFVDVPPPSLEDQRCDVERLKTAAGLEGYGISLPLVRRVPGVLRGAGYRVTVVVSDHEILDVEPGNTADRLLGVAFDIGTTTVVGYMVDLLSGQELAAVSTLNPQVTYGADVVSRINFAMQDPANLARLQSTIIGALNQIIERATEKGGVSPDDIYSATVVGNTCMHHLFLGIDPTNIAVHPYVPVVTEAVSVKGSEVGLNINKSGVVFVLPNIAGFVGADTVGVILAQNMEQLSGVNLAVDIGTNGEMVLGNCGRMLACSTAAGPAFEGAHIACGMRAAPGAIDHVWLDPSGELRFSVVGGVKPTGICGSGLIDAVAVLVQVGIVGPGGELRAPERIDHPAGKRLSDRIVSSDGVRSFVLSDKDASGHGRPVTLTQKDVRELQLSKGAIATGIQILMRELGVSACDVSGVFVAGAFGNYLDPASALAVGLFPREFEGRIRLVGNAAGAGAMKALLRREEYERAAGLARSVGYIELAAHPMFKDVFTASMRFPAV